MTRVMLQTGPREACRREVTPSSFLNYSELVQAEKLATAIHGRPVTTDRLHIDCTVDDVGGNAVSTMSF
jgi:hypothetical protein